MNKPLRCFRVSLKPTNALHTEARHGVECGSLYVVATDIAAVGKEFPEALSIVDIGVGYERKD